MTFLRQTRLLDVHFRFNQFIKCIIFGFQTIKDNFYFYIVLYSINYCIFFILQLHIYVLTEKDEVTEVIII